MPKPLVSIVIPAYNAEKYLEQTIQSVLDQTYSNWELIVVDADSEDDTARVAKTFVARDKRIFYFLRERDGIASGRNAGIEKARGKYIAFLDADNIFLPKKLELQVDYLESHHECGVCYSKILHFYDGKPDIFYENKNEKPFNGEDLLRECLRRNFINVLSVLVRKSVFDAHGAFKQGWQACDEQYVWVNLAYHRVVFSYLDEVVGFLRLHRTSDSARSDYLIRTAPRFLELLDIVDGWFTQEEKVKYSADIKLLRRRWRLRLVLGELMVVPVFSWILRAIFLARRDRNFTSIKRKAST